MAYVYPYDDSPDALFRPAKGLGPGAFFQDWNAADVAEPHLLCAEMSRLAYANQPVVAAALPIAEFTLVSWLGGPRLRSAGAKPGPPRPSSTGSG